MAALEITNIADTVSKDILVRDVNDLFYPREDAIQDFQKMKFSPWHTATFRFFPLNFSARCGEVQGTVTAG